MTKVIYPTWSEIFQLQSESINEPKIDNIYISYT